jgi:hypothetical protein
VLDADGFAIAALGVGGTLLSSVITQVLARRHLVRLWDDWAVMRAAMRRDLGVPD